VHDIDSPVTYAWTLNGVALDSQTNACTVHCDQSGAPISSGVYYYRMSNGAYHAVNSMTLMK
jgi:hypothetical protein